MNLSFLEETDLIKGLQNKSHSAINYFVQLHQQFVYVLCVKMVHQRELAEEITQDVLIKCIKNINAFEGKSKLKTWVYSIAHHEILNYLRKNKIPTTELTESIPVVDNEKNILETFADKDIKLMIQHYFNQLPADQKELLTLFYLNELSLKEIEAVTALSAANIRVKLFRARENFKSLLSEKDVTLLNQIRYE